MRAIGNVSKLVGGVPSSKLNCPPKSCMPKSANINMNRNNRNSNDIIERIEFSNDITRFRRDDQYLKIRAKNVGTYSKIVIPFLPHKILPSNLETT